MAFLKRKEIEEAKVAENPSIAKPEAKKEEVKETFLVVKELPTQPTRNVATDDGKEITLITIEEAIGEILNSVKKLEIQMKLL